MSAYRLINLPSNSSVATMVTLTVSAWFLVAAAAILADPRSPYTERAALQGPVAGALSKEDVAIAPEAHFLVTVEARRG